MTSSRLARQECFSQSSAQAFSHDRTYFEHIGGFGIYLHPNVFSPKYFPGTVWYGETLPSLVPPGRKFLEIGLGTGLVSLYLAAAGAVVVGTDINPKAVQIAQRNFDANGLSGQILRSDLFEDVEGRYDAIFWNHPWASDARSQPDEEKIAMFFDEGYRMLSRFVREASNYLNPGGTVFLGTSGYADLNAMERIYEENGYEHEVVRRTSGLLGGNLEEEYFIIKLWSREQ